MHKVHKNRQKKNVYIYIIIIIAVFIFFNPFNIIGTFRSFGVVLFSPLSHVGQRMGSALKNSLSVVVYMGEMHEQNQLLLQEAQQLHAQVAMHDDIKNENDILRKKMELSLRNDFDLIHAEVVIRDSLGGDQWVMINKGAQDGVEIDAAVIIDDNIFVGYIDSVDRSVSRVRLITHPESVINVVNAKSGAEALSRGHHGLSLVVEDIKKGDVVENGDMFITSQIGNKFPRGLSVGTAQNTSLSDDDLFQSANIIPLAPLGSFRFVSVVKK